MEGRDDGGRVGEDGRLLPVISQSLSIFVQPVLRGV